MSIWADIQARSAGITKRKEDEFVDKEIIWVEIDAAKRNLGLFKSEIEKLQKQQIKLSNSIRELGKFKWDKSKTKCNYTI